MTTNPESYSFTPYPIGYIALLTGLAPRWAWLEAQKLNKAGYSELYAVIGGLYGEDETTFSLPSEDMIPAEERGLYLARPAIKIKG